ncbi:MAG: CoA-binding protein [Erysipelotrichaceae bacterium]|nr:CoA-binding protein [Erysipelotrichaceae bacterium]MDD3809740.1 CoA-binding protein [Erysipelotrichaceae bacterium]
MNLEEVMKYDNFVVLGNTIDKNKYACKIKNRLLDCGYNAVGVYKELESLNDVDFDIEVLDLCINHHLGIKFLKENKKPIKVVVIQPNAGSKEITDFLDDRGIPYIDGCLLVGCSLLNKHIKGRITNE